MVNGEWVVYEGNEGLEQVCGVSEVEEDRVLVVSVCEGKHMCGRWCVGREIWCDGGVGQVVE